MLRRETAVAERGEAVADLEQLVQVFGNHQNRRAHVAQLDQRAVDGCRGADIHAPGRVRRHQQPGLLKNLAAEDEFLQIAAGEARRRGRAVRRLHREALDHLCREFLHARALDQSVPEHAPLLEGGEQTVIGQAHAGHCAVAKTFGGHERQPLAAACIRAQVRHRLAKKADTFGIAPLQGALAGQQREQFVLAVAGDSGDADDLAGTYVQAQLLERNAKGIGISPGQSLHL